MEKKQKVQVLIRMPLKAMLRHDEQEQDKVMQRDLNKSNNICKFSDHKWT